MALKKVEIQFGETKVSAIKLPSTAIATMVSAMTTINPDHHNAITRDQYNNSLLSGWVAPSASAQFTESQIYMFNQNGVSVNAGGSVIQEQYYLSTSVQTNVNEGGSIQIYCYNGLSQLVNISSMKIRVYARFFTGISGDPDARDQLKARTVRQVLDQFAEVQWNYTPTVKGGICYYQGELKNPGGILTCTRNNANSGFHIEMEARAYPASIDDDPQYTTPEQRENARIARLTPSHTDFDGTDVSNVKTCMFTASAVPVTGFIIKPSPEKPIAGTTVSFSISTLLPGNNTKAAALPPSQVTVTSMVAIYTDNGTQTADIPSYQWSIPSNVQSFSIKCQISYWTEIISNFGPTAPNGQEFNVVVDVLSTINNPKMWTIVKTALQLWQDDEWNPLTANSITNDIAKRVPQQYCEDIMRRAAGTDPGDGSIPLDAPDNFDALEFFSQFTELKIPVNLPAMRSIKSTKVTKISGNGTLAAVRAYNFPNCNTITNGNLFRGNTWLTNVDMRAVTTIQNNIENETKPEIDKSVNRMFQGCTSLQTINLLSLLTFICPSNHMFENCTSLKAIDMSSLNRAGGTFSNSAEDYMFSGCTSLGMDESGTDAVIYPSLTNISCNGDISTFKGCIQLKRAPWINNLQTVSSNGNISMFEGCSNLTTTDSLSAETPTNSVSLVNLSSINCLAGTNKMFNGCNRLAKINLSGLTSLKASTNMMFQGCTVLTDVNLNALTTGYGITKDESMFHECMGLVNISLPIAAVTATDNNSMFYGCTSLNNVTMSGLTRISGGPNHMFTGCTALVSITFPELIEIINTDINEMFAGGLQLSSFVAPKLLQIGPSTGNSGTNSMFSGCPSLATIHLPALTMMYTGDNEMFLNDIVLHDVAFESLTDIRSTGTNRMFQGCVALGTGNTYIANGFEHIHLPALRTIIFGGLGNYMFSGCTNARTGGIKKISLPSLTTYRNSDSSSGLDDSMFSGSNFSHFSAPLLAAYRAYNSNIFKNGTNNNTWTEIDLSALTTIYCDGTSNMFRGCHYNSLKINALVSIHCGVDDYTFADSLVTDLVYSNESTTVRFLDTLESIDAGGSIYTFQNGAALTKISLPSIKMLGSTGGGMLSAFKNCTALNEISFGSYSQYVGSHGTANTLTLMGNATEMILNVPSAALGVIVNKKVTYSPTATQPEKDESAALWDNPITSRITNLNVSNFLNNRSLVGDVVFPYLVTMTQNTTLTFSARRIIIGKPAA